MNPQPQLPPEVTLTHCPLCSTASLERREEHIFCVGCNVYIGNHKTAPHLFAKQLFWKPERNVRLTPRQEISENKEIVWQVVAFGTLLVLLILALLRII